MASPFHRAMGISCRICHSLSPDALFCSLPTAEASCLQCWYDACIPDGLDFDSFVNCCTCVLNQEVIDQTQCLLDLTTKFLGTDCCSLARIEFLSFYTEPIVAENSTFPEQGYVFIQTMNTTTALNTTTAMNTTTATNLIYVPAASVEYIVPSITFPCSGCISSLEILTRGNYMESGVSEELTVHLWYRREARANSINGDILYERRTQFNISAVPDIYDGENGLQVLSFAIGEENVAACFQAGDVFGFSLPPASNVPEIAAAWTQGQENVSYTVEEPLDYCDELHPLFEPVPAAAIEGMLQINLQVTGE